MKYNQITIRFKVLLFVCYLLGFKRVSWRVGYKETGSDDGWITYEKSGAIECTIAIGSFPQKSIQDENDEVSPPTTDFVVP